MRPALHATLSVPDKLPPARVYLHQLVAGGSPAGTAPRGSSDYLLLYPISCLLQESIHISWLEEGLSGVLLHVVAQTLSVCT